MDYQRKAKLIEGPIGMLLFKMTLPMFIGILGAISFNLVDTYFIGLYGAKELAAISFTFPLEMFMNAIAMGLGNGATALISRAIGQKDNHLVQRITSDSLSLSLIIAGIFIVIGISTFDPLFSAMGAHGEIRELVKQYMIIWYPGMLFLVVPMVGNNAIRATGDTKTPSMIMLIAVVTNLILDPILIFGWGPVPSLGLAGAAIATVFSRAITLVVSLYVLYHREKMLTLRFPKIKEVILGWKSILHIGIPSTATSMIVPLSIGILTSLIATYGYSAVAGYGVASRVQALALALFMALSSVMSPFVGQNLGAGYFDRIFRGLKLSYYFSIIFGVVIAGMLALFAGEIGTLFTDDPATINVVKIFLYITPIGFGLQGILMIAGASLNTIKRPMDNVVLMALRVFVLYVPLAYIASYFWGLDGIFFSAPIANFATGGLSIWWLNKKIKSEELLMNRSH